MARKIISCTACNARFDVAKYPPGSRVRCGRCQQVLSVPGDSPKMSGNRPSAPENRAAQAFARKGSPGRTAPTSKRRARPAPPPGRKRAAVVPPARPANDIPAPRRPVMRPVEAPPVSTSVSGAPLPERDPLLGALVTGVYRIVRKLGEGGYGAVYEAKDVNLERRVAVKVMLPNRAQSREYVAKFLREARTAAQLSHPNVVAVHGVGYDRDHNVHYLAMEYVEGRTVHDILQERGPMDVDECIDHVTQSCRGLSAAHKRNIIHRDIKPGNLMVTPGGAIKIADFGLAKVYDPDGAQSTVIGTPYFMPPEQFEGKAKDGRTDIYALGVTFYYMLTMKRPHTGSGPAQILLSVMTKEPKSVLEHRPELPEGIWPIVRKMIERDPNIRYHDCDDIVRDLEDLRGGGEEEVEQIYCGACGVPNNVDSTECSGCAESLLETCPKCGAKDVAGTKFCGDCGANIPQERAVVALVDEARTFIATGRLGRAREKLVQARERAPENMGTVDLLAEVDRKREFLDGHCATVRRLLQDGRVAAAKERLDEARAEFAEAVEIKDLDEELALHTDGAEEEDFVGDDAENARRLEADGRVREALVAWRGILVLTRDDPDAQAGERRLAEKVDLADALATEAADLLGEGSPEAACEKIREAAALLPGDNLIGARLADGEKLATEFRAELDELSAAAEAGGSPVLVDRVRALEMRFPRSEQVKELLSRLEDSRRTASRQASREEVEKLLETAAAQEEGKRLREALRAYRKAAGLDGDNSVISSGLGRVQARLAEFEAVLSQGRALLDGGDPDRSVARTQAALEILPADPGAQALLARARTTLETLTHEAERIRDKLGDEPEDDDLNWAQDLAARYPASALAADVLREAEQACRQAEEKAQGEKIKPALDRAAKLEEEGSLVRAVAAYKDALKAAPDHAPAKEAVERLEKRLAEAQENAQEATRLLAEGDPEGARDAARTSLELLPHQPGPAGVLAQARNAVGEIERAQSALQEGLAPKRARAQLDRARRVAEKFKASERCGEIVDRATKLLEVAEGAETERERRRHLDAARTHLEEARLGAAAESCEAALALQENDQEATALLQDVQGRRKDAADKCSAGREAAEAGRHSEAFAAFEAALAADGDLEGAKTGRDAAREAVAAFEKTLHSAVSGAHDAVRKEGLVAAAAAWAAVLELDPDHDEAVRESEHLEKEVAVARTSLATGRQRLDAGDPESAVEPLDKARTALGADEELDGLVERAKREAEDLRSQIGQIRTSLGREGDLSQPAEQAKALAERFPGSTKARELAESAERTCGERRRSLAVVRVKALIREGRLQEALDLAAELKAEGVDTPELTTAVQDAEKALGALNQFREVAQKARTEGRLEDAREALGKIVEALPRDGDTKAELLTLDEVIREVAARRDMAESARRRGSLAEALTLYEEASQFNPGSRDLSDTVERIRGEVQERKMLLDTCGSALTRGDAEVCVSSAAKLLKRYPDDDDAQDLHTTGECLQNMTSALLRVAERQLQSDQRVAANKTLDCLLRVAPGHERAKMLRAG